jgi:hypothetical protein
MNLVLDITLTVVTAVDIGLVQLAKTAGLPTRWCPLLAVVLGIVGLLSLTFFQPVTEVIFTGIVIGLTSVGLYSGTRATAGK